MCWRKHSDNIPDWRSLLSGLILWLACLCPLVSASATLHLPAEPKFTDYSNHIEYWCPSARLSSLSDAQAAHFQPVTHQFHSPSAASSICWFKLAVQSDANTAITWIFSNHWTPIDFLDVWVLSDTHAQHFTLGDHRPYQDRIIKSRLPAFPVSLAPHQNATIYIRAESRSLIAILGSLSPAEVFEAQDKADDVTFGLYFGVFGMMALIALLMGLWIKDPAMLAYSGYVASFLLVTFAVLGYASVFFWTTRLASSDIMIGVFSLMLLFSITSMWIHLLQLKIRFKKLYWLFAGTRTATIIALPMVLSPFYTELQTALRVISFPFNIIPPFILAILWYQHKKTEHLIYLLSFTGLLLSSFTYISMTENILPLTLNKAYLYIVMLLINIFIMSIGMAFRVRQIQLDKVAADSKAELALQRTQEERRFVAMLSHEFRNPLATIDRSAQMLILTNPDITPASTTRFNNIRASVSRLSSLVDNFLISERLQEERLTLHASLHSTTDLIEDIRSHFTDEDWQRIQVESIRQSFHFDLNLISMAVGNLLHNALRYALPDTMLQLNTTVQHNALHILVADEGPGISEEEMQMLGTPYYRAPNAFGKKGTGLGYYFCRRIVELHGGELTASKNNAGGLNVLIVLKRELAQ
ncbi:sensor histidine kinase [Methylophilus aquaticus]|uniref:histidine kinase n=1 Tax=Methylophilus aquaticus TaxID=1971610 RepID=A0ABT9JSQ0_9PROT|nr:sensor histidine kinase [Methylophilus aquaticus]MDP8567578.1 sensor histidine kinase [Methylophilus aquaticus]